MSSSKQHHQPECTSKCRSLIHADDVISAISKGGNEEEQVVVSYLQWLCANYAQLTDRFGRTAVHMAASCGKGQILRWLFAIKNCKGHVRDWESGWSPLHRSLFYGQLLTATILMENGASLSTLDHDGFTPINIAMKDRPAYVEYRNAGVNEVYIWGTNHNYNLGLGSSQSRSTPESLDTFRKESINVDRVVMRKFHTLFLTRGGQVYVCGHGQQGRLGITVEKTALKPQILRSISKEICVEIVAGTDHSVMLMESGSIWSCGSNEYHQLGHLPPPDYLLTPKMITTIKNVGSKNVVGICAGRFHTVICLRDLIYTFGLNAGQLGHLDQGDHLQTSPRIVSALTKQKLEFSHVAASHAATVCVTTAGDVYVLHQYQCRKIASKQLDVSKVLISGGSLDPKACPDLIKDGGGSELRILLLQSSGQMSMWSESSLQLSRCLYSITRSLKVIDVQLFNTGLIMATNDGEGFIATILPPKCKKQEPESPRLKVEFTEWIDRDECYQLKMKRLPNIHRAVSVACDHKGRNFSILQAHPKASLLEIPQLSPSNMKSDLKNLLFEAEASDGIQDCIIKVGKVEVAAHRFILASRSRFMTELIGKSTTNILNIDKVNATVLKDVLEYLYTDSCRWLKDGEAAMTTQNYCAPDLISSMTNGENSKKKGDKSVLNAFKLFKEAAKRFELRCLEKRLEAVVVSEGRVTVVDKFLSTELQFNRNKMQELCDVSISCLDGIVIKCHKCVLVARSDYFRGMLASSSWSETSSSISLPISADIMENVIDCLYTDKAPKLFANDDVEFICNVLVTADRLLLATLKELCEIRLTDLLTLKNATELLEISWIYNAVQLKSSAMQFIGLNLPALLEMKSLSSLSDEILIELTKSYRQLIPQMCYRVVTPYESGPTLEEMRAIHETFPADLDAERVEVAKEKRKSRTPRKSLSKKEDLSSQQRDGGHIETSLISLRMSDSESSLDGSARLTMSPPSLSLASPSPILSQFQYSYSPPTPVWLHDDEDIDDAFPDLLCEIKPANIETADKTRSLNESFRSRGKLSQKQRKRLPTAPVPIPNSVFKENMIKKQNAWGNVSSPSESPSLSDIMHIEWNSNRSFERNQSVEEPTPTRLINPEGKTNPWQNSSLSKVQSQPKTSKNCFANILLEEKQQADYLAKCQSKPLRLIQLEDQAIEDLLTLYQAGDNPEEFVTVERVLPTLTATPIWKLTAHPL